MISYTVKNKIIEKNHPTQESQKNQTSYIWMYVKALKGFIMLQTQKLPTVNVILFPNHSLD